ncbi:KIDINS220 [Symbiodinium necroappetens]|uniref:KIDINS220 protein n=1 Tax=Symbiodinium necroappetens TaxID=1628268 RepID=A0A812YZB3_9DINO|nr:KIDINS220 [Symbiodinium necroappetens]
MCRFTPEPELESMGSTTQVLPTVEDKKVPIRVKRANVEKLIAAAVEATQETSNNSSLKRRIRQRLHKKLGSILSKKDFAAAMDKHGAQEFSSIMQELNRGTNSADAAMPAPVPPAAVVAATAAADATLQPLLLRRGRRRCQYYYCSCCCSCHCRWYC